MDSPQSQDGKISCIIPARNEASRIEEVLKIVEGHPLLSEIIVVNGHSSDKTSEVVEKHKDIRLLDLHEDRGKSFSVAKGIEAAKYDVLMLLDADLHGLKKEDISALAKPVLDEKVDMTISTRRNSFYRWLGVDYFSGERVFRKNLFKDYKEWENLKSYLVEAFINEKIIKNNWRIKSVPLNAINPLKYKKAGFLKGWKQDVDMTFLIARYLGFYRYLKMVVKMFLLAHRNNNVN